jgi:CheY-like chemotaxis protein
VPKTLLAVDDSATMRKVLEITFGGDDFTVITADGHDTAIAKLAEQPKVVLIDAALTGDGYALCQEIRKRDPNVTLVLLSSRYNPYDASRGKDVGADDFMDKPFDTQAAIDKVRKAVLARESGGPAHVAAAPAPAVQTSPSNQAVVAPAAAAPPAAAAAPPPAKPAVPGAPPVKSRSATLMFDGNVPAPKPMSAVAPAHAAPPPVQAAPAPAPIAAPAPVAAPAPIAAPVAAPAPIAAPAAIAHPAPAPTAVAAAVNGRLSTKLGDLGLTPQQADAVMALSREVVERIVWEVVPQLAEALIKEEIARLTKEG